MIDLVPKFWGEALKECSARVHKPCLIFFPPHSETFLNSDHILHPFAWSFPRCTMQNWNWTSIYFMNLKLGRLEAKNGTKNILEVKVLNTKQSIFTVNFTKVCTLFRAESKFHLPSLLSKIYNISSASSKSSSFAHHSRTVLLPGRTMVFMNHFKGNISCNFSDRNIKQRFHRGLFWHLKGSLLTTLTINLPLSLAKTVMLAFGSGIV